MPLPVSPTAVLQSRREWQSAVAECRRLRLPLHRDRPKNWDALAAVALILEHLGRDVAVLDAGSARYSSVLPWLRMYRVRELIGINLEFDRPVVRDGVRFQHGDVTAADFPDSTFHAVTCMSVIEHGVDADAFVAEVARILRPGGLLIVSTDYDEHPPDVAGLTMYGQPVRIFSPADISALVAAAAKSGLTLLGDLEFSHPERPIHWRRTGLDYTFIRLCFAKDPCAPGPSRRPID